MRAICAVASPRRSHCSWSAARRSDFTDREIAAVDAFLQRGGGALLLLEAGAPPRVQELVREVRHRARQRPDRRRAQPALLRRQLCAAGRVLQRGPDAVHGCAARDPAARAIDQRRSSRTVREWWRSSRVHRRRHVGGRRETEHEGRRAASFGGGRPAAGPCRWRRSRASRSRRIRRRADRWSWSGTASSRPISTSASLGNRDFFLNLAHLAARAEGLIATRGASPSGGDLLERSPERRPGAAAVLARRRGPSRRWCWFSGQ